MIIAVPSENFAVSLFVPSAAMHGALTLGFAALWNRQIAVKLACPVHSQAYDLLSGIDGFSEQQI